MSGATLALWMLWAAAAVLVAVTVAALATRRITLLDILTSREWKTAAQLAAIVAMVLLIIYVQNANRYDAEGFIYGRF